MTPSSTTAERSSAGSAGHPPPAGAVLTALQRHPAVAAAAVICATNAYWGPILTAHVGLRPRSATITPGDIAAWLAAELGPASIPRRVHLDVPSSPRRDAWPS